MVFLIILAVTVLLYLYYYVIHPAILSPLAAIPNAHVTCPISSFWICWKRYTGEENESVLQLHRDLGPLVRLGPNEISVSRLEDGIKLVFAGKFEKHATYDRFCIYEGVRTLFTFLESKPHAGRLRVIAKVFQNSYLQQSGDIAVLAQEIILNRYSTVLEQHLQEEKPFDAGLINDALAVDFITGFVFGSSCGTNLLMDPSRRQQFLSHLYSERSTGFWEQEFPTQAKMVRLIGLSLKSKTARQSLEWLKAWCIQTYELSCQGQGGSAAILLEHLRRAPTSAKTEDDVPKTKPALMSELLCFCIAEWETIGPMVTNAMRALSAHPMIQQRLREELKACFGSGDFSPSMLKPAKLSEAPFLHAIVTETLRHRYRTPLTRVIPDEPISMCGSPELPPGTKVTVSSYVLHQNETVFANPGVWDPWRWMAARSDSSDTEHSSNMYRNYFGFGGGDRTCLGQHLALFQMKALLALVYTRYATTLASEKLMHGKEAGVGDDSGRMILTRID